MVVKRFSTFEKLVAGAAALLVESLSHQEPGPLGVMLSGGQTPRPVFEAVASSRTDVSPNVHVLFTDERMVPEDHSESNYNRAKAMLQAVGVPESRRLRVHTHVAVDVAADEYHRELNTFFERGGQMILGLLGLGADGHTALSQD